MTLLAQVIGNEMLDDSIDTFAAFSGQMLKRLNQIVAYINC